VTREAKRRLARAQDRLKHLGDADTATWQQTLDELHQAERLFAAERGEQYAEVLDTGGAWDAGAPLPHLLAGPHSTYIVCYARDVDPSWDGTYVTMRSPADEDASSLLLIEIVRCHEVRMGGPNDEAINGHALHGRGLGGYQAHEVRNSEWLESVIRVNSVHPHHSDAPFRRLHHYVLPFHDEMIEALGQAIQVTHVQGSIRALLLDLVNRITADA
jgi:hypothetical protein